MTADSNSITVTRTNHSLLCISTNADSFLNKIEEFKNRFLNTDRPDIIAITEVLPKNARYPLTKAELQLPGYEMFPNNFPDKSKRGTIIYVTNKLKAVELQLETNFNESVCVKIN